MRGPIRKLQGVLCRNHLNVPALSLKSLVQMSNFYHSATWACLKNPEQMIVGSNTTQIARQLTERFGTSACESAVGSWKWQTFPVGLWKEAARAS